MSDNPYVESSRVMLTRYQELISELLKSWSKPHISGERTSTDIMRDVVSCDAELMTSLRNLHASQQKQCRAELIEREIQHKTRTLQDIAGKLKAAELALLESIGRAKTTIASFEKAQASPLSVTDVVSYAHKICYSTAAPAGWNIGDTLVMNHPPMPTQEEIQQGLYYTKEALALGSSFVPSTHASPMMAGGTPLMAHPSPLMAHPSPVMAAGSPYHSPFAHPSPMMAAGSPVSGDDSAMVIPTLDMSASALALASGIEEKGTFGGSLFGLQSSSESDEGSDEDDEDSESEEDDDVWE